ncbi:ATP-binding protein [Streptomyces sp. NPDC020965]|uniref:ATP-binding protein n=1 Tax=Streptomyces sp. NPDC020965 TaxID=3365105 RepID=UPI003791C38F
MAALDGLTRAAKERGYAVRATVADIANTRMALRERPGWQKLAPFLSTAKGGMLFVRSRAELGWDDAHRADVLGWLAEHRVSVTASEPASWETADWLRVWTRTNLPCALGGGVSCPAGSPPPPGLCCAVFPALEAHAPTVRRLSGHFLRAWESMLTGHDLDLLLVAVNELVINAIKHGSRPGDLITLTLECDERALHVGVEDGSAEPPCLGRAGDDDDCGRGLPLVQQIGDGWGYIPHLGRSGKRVWMNVLHQRSLVHPLPPRCPDRASSLSFQSPC